MSSFFRQLIIFWHFCSCLISRWLWLTADDNKNCTNFLLLATFGTQEIFEEGGVLAMVKYQCIFLPSSAHQLMFAQSITIPKVFRWLTSGVRRTLCFFSWCHHFLATRRGKFSGHRSIDILMMMRCRSYFCSSCPVWHRWCFERVTREDGKISLIDAELRWKSEAKGASCDDC